MSSVGDVVAQLRDVIERLDRAAVTASRVQEDAAKAQSLFTDVGRGTDHQQIRRAITESRTAGEKAGKVGRLLGEAASHFAAYANEIAPGSAPPRERATDVLPTGEELLGQADDKGSKADRFIRRHVKKLDDTEGTLQKTEAVATQGVKKLFQIYKGQPGSTGTQAPAPPPAPAQQPQVEHPGTAVVIAAGAVALGIRKSWEKIKKRREGTSSGDQA